MCFPGRLHMDRAGVGSGVRRGDRRPRTSRRRTSDTRPGRRRQRTMVAAGATHQGDARHVRARRRGHDIARGPARSRHTQESAHQI